VTETAARRPRARIGQGARLRIEIVAAARAILVREGDVGAVTLRAVAREIGIAAPSIYLHFPTLDDLLAALLRSCFTALQSRLEAGITLGTTTAERLRFGCRGYCAFAIEDPASYGVLFTGALHRAHTTVDPLIGIDVFQILVQGVADGMADGTLSTAGDAFATARAIWAGLHGQVSLRAGNPAFPWDPLDEAIDRLLHDVAGLSN
jgi:AcrR family transcriptional regulator